MESTTTNRAIYDWTSRIVGNSSRQSLGFAEFTAKPRIGHYYSRSCLTPTGLGPFVTRISSPCSTSDIDMDNSNTPTSRMDMMMPYLHFTGGDNLFFKSWHPSSNGAIAGASIALVVLALSERLLFSIRGAMEARWRRRYGLRDSFRF